MTTEMVQREHDKEQNECARAEPARRQSFRPRFDIWETETEVVLCGDLPGVAPEDLEIHYEDRELTILGKMQPRPANVRYLHEEYSVGDYYRTFTIGETIDAHKITAEMKQGVLTLHLPKAQTAKPRRVEVRIV